MTEQQKELTLDEALQQLAEAQRQAAENYDKYLRLAAEADNTRKRIERDTAARALREKRAFLTRWLDIVDDLERALSYAGAGQGLREGVALAVQNMRRALELEGVTPVTTEVGQPFDPYLHEAVAVQPGDEPQPVIVEVTRTGYRHKDDLLRPAQVVVRQAT